MPFRYQIVVQWSDGRGCYEAFSPTLMEHVHKFIPGHPTLSFGSTPEEATNAAQWQAQSVLRATRQLAILPPPADIRKFTDFDSTFEYADNDYALDIGNQK